jgi:hypothetical protein
MNSLWLFHFKDSNQKGDGKDDGAGGCGILGGVGSQGGGEDDGMGT